MFALLDMIRDWFGAWLLILLAKLTACSLMLAALYKVGMLLERFVLEPCLDYRPHSWGRLLFGELCVVFTVVIFFWVLGAMARWMIADDLWDTRINSIAGAASLLGALEFSWFLSWVVVREQGWSGLGGGLFSMLPPLAMGLGYRLIPYGPWQSLALLIALEIAAAGAIALWMNLKQSVPPETGSDGVRQWLGNREQGAGRRGAG